MSPTQQQHHRHHHHDPHAKERRRGRAALAYIERWLHPTQRIVGTRV
jgi:hypothetical protein